MNNSSKTPLAIPAVIWSIGLVAAKFIKTDYLLLVALFVLFLFASLKKQIRVYSVIFLILILAFMRWDIHTVLPRNHIHYVLEKRATILQPIEGKIISEVKQKDRNYKFILKLTKLKNAKIDGKITFSTFQEGLKYGDVISCAAQIRKIRTSSNPNNFDYKEYLTAKGIYASGSSRSFIKLIGYKPAFFKKVLITTKKFIRVRIEKRFYRYSNFTKAIVLAEKQNLDNWRESLTLSGLSHLLAVSGLHIAIISLVIFTLLKIFILNRYILRISVISILIFYGFIADWPPSVMRAITMIVLYLTAGIIQRKPNPNNILAATLIIVTAINPNQLFSAGFQMSFFAVFTLFNVNIQLKFGGSGKIIKFIKGILTVIIYSFILNLSLAPITMYHFNSLNFNGAVSNVFGIPMLGIILPLALLIIFLPLKLSIPFQYSYYFMMKLFEKAVDFTKTLPFHYDFVRLNGIRFIILLTLVVIILAFKKMLSTKKLIPAIAVLIIIFLFPYKQDSNLKITMFDCGLGDMAFVQTPDKHTVFIDTGPGYFGSKRFEKSALPYLHSNGISTIDRVIITHAHNDHYGGLGDILADTNVKSIMVTDEFIENKVWKKFTSSVKAEQSNVTVVTDTMSFNIGKVKFKILHPDKNYSNRNINNRSIVVRLDYGEFSALFTGDLENEGEQYILGKYRNFLDTDFLKVGHHGSKTSSTEPFIESVSPQIAFMSTPMKNKFGFPHYSTLMKYRFLKNMLFISGKDGALILDTDGKTLKYHTMLSERKGTLTDIKK